MLRGLWRYLAKGRGAFLEPAGTTLGPYRPIK